MTTYCGDGNMNYFTTTSSYDITFCGNRCKRVECHRNKRSKHYKTMEGKVYSICNFECEGKKQ
jgi:adenosyl cobinamide kinase/adenosyl cobinamide phosphate guanylyltransferase